MNDIIESDLVTKKADILHAERIGDVMARVYNPLQEHDKCTKSIAGVSTCYKDINVPVVIASQLNRALENRSDKRPILSDFREALWVKKYADVVMLIYRDKMHDVRKSNKEKTEIIIAKNSHGAVGSVELGFFPKSGVFESLGE